MSKINKNPAARELRRSLALEMREISIYHNNMPIGLNDPIAETV